MLLPTAPQRRRVARFRVILFVLGASTMGWVGCRSPRGQVEEADRVAYATIAASQQAVLGTREPFTIQPPAQALRQRLMEEQNLQFADPVSVSARRASLVPHWPDDILASETSSPEPAPVSTGGNAPVVLTLIEALQVAARNSHAYQDSKESMFEEALTLDLRRYDFDSQVASSVESTLTSDNSGEETTREFSADGGLGVTRKLQNGALLSAGFTLNFLEILKGSAESSLGLDADVSLTLPLLRGAGRHIAREPLTQAERNMLYAVYRYERFKREFVVDVVQEYLGVLRQLDGVKNAEENYARLRESVERTQAMAEEERLPGIQVGQARQDELRARSGWISAQKGYAGSLDRFKISLGLPPDSGMVLDPAELTRVLDVDTMPDLTDLEVPTDAAEPVPEPWLDEVSAMEIALLNRLDLKEASGQVEDAQRQVVVAVDRLRPELTLGGTASWPASGDPSDFDQTLQDVVGGKNGIYSGLITVDPGLDRRVERDVLRSKILAFQASVRSYQAAEDSIKLDIREAIRDLQSSREDVVIQRNAVELAMRRVESTELFLTLERAEVRDLLEAQSDLLDARNAYTLAQVDYRVAFLSLQRDLGLLEVDEDGIWTERHYQNLRSE